MGLFKPKLKEFKDILFDALQYGDTPQKVLAIKAIQEINGLHGIILNLLSDHEYVDVRQVAVQFLEKSGDLNDINYLYETVKNSNNSDIRKTATHLIIHILEQRLQWSASSIGMSRISLLEDLVNEDSHDIKKCTLAILRYKRDDDYFLTFEMILNDKELDIAILSAQVLREIGNIRSLIPVLRLLEKIAALVDDPNEEEIDEQVLDSIANILGQISKKSTTATGIIEDTFIDALLSRNPTVRATAATVLGNIESTKCTDSLIQLLEDPEDTVREAAVEALGCIKSSHAVKPLINLLNDSTISWNAARALGEIGDSSALFPLIYSLQSCDDDTRRAIFGALGQIGDHRAVEHLIELSKYSHTYGFLTLHELISTLGEFKDARALPYLIKMLEHEHKDIRAHSAWALGFIGNMNALQPLENVLKGDFDDVRKSAEHAICEIKRLSKPQS